MSCEEIADAPVFSPSFEEFSNFQEYLTSIEEEWKKAGLCKIIPPQEWRASIPLDFDKIDQIIIPAPIKQYVTGNKGIYQLMLIESKKLTVAQFREQAEKEKIPKSNKYKKEDEVGNDDVDRIFWKNVRFNPPTYGADMLGSFMDENVKVWNLNHLDSILQIVKEKVPGITAPYLYFGMWKAMFAWHVEDMNLFSINYLHFGQPKTWYSIPSEFGPRFETLCRGYFPELNQNCSEFLRHKTTLISPYILAKYNIPLRKMVQREGEIMLTYPYSYHSGFNHGFNCAESVNFALESWINYGNKAEACRCNQDSVKIDMNIFLERYEAWKSGSLDLDSLVIQPTVESSKEKKKRPRKDKTETQEEAEKHEKVKEDQGESEELTKKKKKVSEEEIKILENYLETAPSGLPDRYTRERLAKQVGWTPQGVYNWIRRQKKLNESRSHVTSESPSPSLSPRRKRSNLKAAKISDLLNPSSEEIKPGDTPVLETVQQGKCNLDWDGFNCFYHLETGDVRRISMI